MKYIFSAAFLLFSSFVFSQSIQKDLKTPKGFVLYLIQLSKEGNKKEWTNILSRELKERHKDSNDYQRYVDTHFNVWSPEFIAVAKKHDDKLDQLVVESNDANTIIKIEGEFSMRVTKEHGEFRINEN